MTSAPIVAQILTRLGARTRASSDRPVATLGFVNSSAGDRLTYAVDEFWVRQATKDTAIAGIVVPPEHADRIVDERPDLWVFAADEPAAAFWQTHNLLSVETDFYGRRRGEPPRIHPTARIAA